MANQHYNGTIDFKVDGREYEATVSATATYTFIKGRKYMANGDPGYPDEEDFEIDDLDVTLITDKETEEIVDETEEMTEAIRNALEGAEWEDDDPPEPDYDDYWAEREIEKYESDCIRMGY